MTSKINDTTPIQIFDTTLRDGEQSPGAAMTHEEKLQIAELLDEMGVDVIEAGFPISSPGDFKAVQEISKIVKRASVCGLSRAGFKDIDRAGEALKGAHRPRIHTFISTSPVHMKHKLNMGENAVLEAVGASVTRARNFTSEVEWSAEDATRTVPDFLCKCVEVAIHSGATVINVPDTVGYSTPQEFFDIITMLRTRVPNADKVIFSTHCHNDLGLGVANSLAGVLAGARQVECTINGIGERAGNASMEEVVMALRVRGAFFGVDTGIDARKLYPTSRLLTQLTGQAVARNKAVVGENAFAHESGIHQHGMLKHRGTYEIMRPQDVGMGETRLVLGKHSGRHALRQRLQSLGHEVDEAAMDNIFARFKALADKKREVHDQDLEAIALGMDPEATGPWRIVQLNTNSHLGGSASASVKLTHDSGHEVGEAAIGDGPVDAVLRAIERATGTALDVTQFQVRAVSEGGDAQGQAQLTARHAERDWRGSGVSTDIIEATAHAALAIVNRIERQQPVTPRAAVAAL